MRNAKPQQSTEQYDESDEGPGELTLVLYSVFMAVSSLVFGGLGLFHARGGSSDSLFDFGAIAEGLDLIRPRWSVLRHNVELFVSWIRSIDPVTILYLGSVLALVGLIAIWTNPGETSFRSYLTNLTLHEHLRQLRDDVRHQPASTGKTSTEEELEGATSTEARCISRSSPHFLTFANRISVSLRTPAYRRRSYGLFSIVTVPAQPDLPASIEGGRDGAKETGLVSTQYIGLFGQWTHWGRSTTELPASEGASRIEKKNSKRAKVLAPQSWGILCMRSGRQVDEEKLSHVDVQDAAKSKSSKIGEAQLPPPATSQGQKGAASRRKKASQRPKLSQQQASTGKDPERRGSDDLELQTLGSLDADRRTSDPLVAQPLDTTQAHASDAMNVEQASAALASLESSTSPNATLAEAQMQLESLRTASEASRKQLQAQLDELRGRKRDEDAARVDVKGKTKTLDESKRLAEASRREAERRLKVATSLRETIQARIDVKDQEVKELREKEREWQRKVEEGGQRKVEHLEQLGVDKAKTEREEMAVDKQLGELRAKLEMLEQRVMEEDANLEAARELAAERRTAAMSRPIPPFSSQSHQGPQMYPLISGPGEGPPGGDAFDRPDASADLWTASAQQQEVPPGYKAYVPSQPHQSQPGHLSPDFDEDNDDTFDPTLRPGAGFSPFSFEANPAHLQAYTDHFNSANNHSNSNSNSSGLVPPTTTSHDDTLAPLVSPARTPQRSRLNSLAYGSDVSATPISPFSSDLLPSNLFQNADDDDRHVGVMPGSRNERVEAALNRFGLDTSDTSDLETGREGEDVESDDQVENDDVGDTTLQGKMTGGEEMVQRKNSASRGARSWWGGRSRTASKDRTANDEAALEEQQWQAQDDGSGSKRRSLSIFPKLSLNPGAKAFSSSAKRKPDNNGGAFAPSDLAAQGGGWNAGAGRGGGPDFESMRRAFQTSGLANDDDEEEQGRRSWSAFDSWQQSHQPASTRSRLGRGIYGAAGEIGKGRPSHLAAATNSNFDLRSSSESLPFQRGGTTGQGANQRQWLDEMFLPLNRSTSAGARSLGSHASSQGGGGAGTGGQASTSNSRPSRFAFWSTNGASNASNQSAASLQSSDAAGAASSTDPEAQQQGDVEEALPASERPKTSSRRSFRWSRRITGPESSSSDANAGSQDQE